MSPQALLPKRGRAFPKYGAGWPSNDKGWVKVMMIKEAKNVCHQGADTAKTARANHLECNLPKEAFDQVEPG
jgi:hypothetical protein